MFLQQLTNCYSHKRDWEVQGYDFNDKTSQNLVFLIVMKLKTKVRSTAKIS